MDPIVRWVNTENFITVEGVSTSIFKPGSLITMGTDEKTEDANIYLPNKMVLASTSSKKGGLFIVVENLRYTLNSDKADAQKQGGIFTAHYLTAGGFFNVRLKTSQTISVNDFVKFEADGTVAKDNTYSLETTIGRVWSTKKDGTISSSTADTIIEIQVIT